MAQDPSQDDHSEPPRLGRGLLFAGVAMAGLLGVGLGLWARPADSERHPGKAGAMRPVAVAPKPTRSLEIVVDDRPAEIGGPIEVMAKAPGQIPAQAQGPGPAVSHFAVDAPAPAPAEVDPEPVEAPRRAAEGLVKVQAIAVPAPAPAPVEKPAPAPAAKPAPAKLVKAAEPKRAAPQAKPAEPRLQKAKTRPEPKPAKPTPAKLVKVKAQSPARPKAKVAKVEQAAKARLARAEARLIKVETKAKPKIAALLHVLKTKPQPKPAPKTRVARAEKPLRAAKLQLASARVEKKAAKPRVEKAVARPATPKAPAPARLTKVANRCASSDPGAAVVCADPSLGAADRELARAYRQAEAAGVPAWRLQQQQQHWLAARANAARQAPWAVRDVYQARIAELHDQARSAASDY